MTDQGMPRWEPNPNITEYQRDELTLPNGIHVIARIEDFDYAAYPMALNATTGNWERGGAYTDRVEAMLWAERVAGLHPAKPEDERPAFYYDPDKGESK